ncbi:hypothetical protein K9M74_02465 [Candidatus Woesearchaeota archaeon]|nr:hypothetical protein [Candidatus Woesearchaeota archaeon]
MQHLNKYVGWGIIFLLLVTTVFAFDFSICDTPQQAKAELGDDYYAFCETNVDLAYRGTLAGLQEDSVAYNDSSLSFPTRNNSSRQDFSSDFPDEMLDDSTTFTQFFIIAGFLLLGSLCILLVWRYRHLHHTHKEAVEKLLPTLHQYRQAGYTDDQIANMLLARGYEQSFINKLLRALEV